MRKIVGVALAFTLALSLTAAAADTLEGKVQSIDQGDRVLVLEDGTKVWLAEGLGMDQIKEGATVKASYEMRDGKPVATSIDVSE